MDKDISAKPRVYFRKIVGKDIKRPELTSAWRFLRITDDQFCNYVAAYIGYWGAIDHAFDPIEVAARRVEQTPDLIISNPFAKTLPKRCGPLHL
jgi:hypothetical protein